MQLVLALVLNAAAFMLTSYILGAVGIGFHVANWQAALIAAIVLGLINTFIKPILVFLTLPLTIITLGLFIFVVNAIVLWLAAAFVPGLTIDGFWPAILAAIVLSVVSTALSSLAQDIVKK